MSNDIHSPYRDDVRFAAFRGDVARVKEWIDKGENVDAKDDKGMTLMHFAALVGHGRMIDLLSDYNGNIYAKNEEGLTPLHFAAARGELEAIEALSRNARNREIFVDARDVDGRAPIHLAAEYNQRDTVRALIAFGSDVDARDSEGGDSFTSGSRKGDC